MWLYIFGFAVHVVFFISVFDIYFRTPIIHGMEPQSSPLEPEAKRLVLFVADGLRADSFFNYTDGSSRAPYLRSVIEHEGTWGVSHTHVPTESRPGHVAILAGLYEDPSAIARGWRENPVHFDHILNQTKHAWAWGSPDIVPMFASGPHSAHISTASYTSQEEDFASADASKLDTWVFDKLEELLRNATTDKRLNQELHSNRIMFFLHLLGLDTNGHSHKPHSQEYLRNIELVDKGIQRAVHLLNDFYRDNQTAFVFTADHGMTSWGSHGAGEASETETPIVAWGRGVSPPQDPSSFQASRMVFDARVSDWGLSHVRRHDMHQADIAPLMAALLNTPVPVNNVGTLPVEYLSGSARYRAEALFANARQLLAQFRARRQTRQSAALPLLYSPYKPLSLDAEISYLTKIRNALNKEKYEEVISTCHTLLHLSEAGINYYHNYDRPGLTLSITLAFIGWMALIVCQILQYDTGVLRVASHSIEGRRAAKKSSFWCGVVACWGVSTLLLNVVQGSPVQHLLYHLLPVVVWGVLVWRWLGVVRVAWLLLHHYNMVWETAIRLLAIFIGVQILVFSFHARMMLCAGLVCVGAWPLVLYSPSSGGGGTSLTLCWLGACLLLSSFAILPPVVGMAPSYTMVEGAGLIALILGGCALYGCGVEGAMRLTGGAGSAVQGVLVLVTLATIHSTSSSLDLKQGLPPLNQWAAWLLLGGLIIYYTVNKICHCEVMGNSDSTLGLDNLHVDRTNCQVYNDWTLASGDLDNLPIVVFSATHPATSKKRPYMERALQASRVYRHPGLLRYIAGGVVGGGSGEVVLVMEESMPLQHCHQTLSPLQVIAGLTSIVKTLVFLHDTAGVSHNNLSTSSIFVTPDQSWKLWGLEYSCSFSDLSHRHLAQIQSFCHESALPPDDTSRIVPAYQHARDAYSFANLVEDLLMRYPAIGDVPGAEDFILLLRREAQHREWSHRPRFEALQQHALFQHTFLRIHHHLSTLLLMPDLDRDTFLSGLVSSLRQYPEAVVACSLAPALLARPVLLVPKSALAILPAVLTPIPASEAPPSPALVDGVEGLFSEAVFSEHIVPRVVELYGLHDLPIRELLLEYLPCYLHLVPKDVLKDDVLPEVLLGIQDCSEALVCRSLRALAVLVPVLGADCVVGRRRHAIFAAVQPKAAPSSPDQRGVPRHSLAKPSLKPLRKGWEERVSPAAIDGDDRATELNGRSSPDGGEDLLSGGTSVRGGPGSTAISGTGSDMNLGVLLEGQRSPDRGSSEGGIEGGRGTERLAKDTFEDKRGQNERGHGEGGSRLGGGGSKEGRITTKPNLDRYNKHSDANHSMLDGSSKESPKRSLGFKHGGVGFNEIFGSNAEDSDDAQPTIHKEDLVANFLLGSDSPSEVKISANPGSGRETTKSLFDPETASQSEENSDEGADWSDWDDVNDDNMGTDFTAALSSLNSLESTTRGVTNSEGNFTESKGHSPASSVLYDSESTNQRVDRSENRSIHDNISSGLTTGRLEASSTVGDIVGSAHHSESSSKTIREKALSSNVNRNVDASKGLGEEFDILSIEVKKKPDTELDWFADLAPNLNHKKFDLERLLEEANAKSKSTHDSDVKMSEQSATKTDFLSSEKSVRLEGNERSPAGKHDTDAASSILNDSRVPSDEGRGLRHERAAGPRDKLPSVSDTLAQCLDRDSEGQGWDNESDGGWTDQLDFEDSGSPVKKSEFEDFSSPMKSADIDGLLTPGDTVEQFDEPWNQDQSFLDTGLGTELDSVLDSQNDVQIDDMMGFEERRTESASDVYEQPHHPRLIDVTEGEHKNEVLESDRDSMTAGESLDDLVHDYSLKESEGTSNTIERSLASIGGQTQTDRPVATVDFDAPQCELMSCEPPTDLLNLDASDDR